MRTCTKQKACKSEAVAAWRSGWQAGRCEPEIAFSSFSHSEPCCMHVGPER